MCNVSTHSRDTQDRVPYSFTASSVLSPVIVLSPLWHVTRGVISAGAFYMCGSVARCHGTGGGKSCVHVSEVGFTTIVTGDNGHKGSVTRVTNISVSDICKMGRNHDYSTRVTDGVTDTLGMPLGRLLRGRGWPVSGGVVTFAGPRFNRIHALGVRGRP